MKSKDRIITISLVVNFAGFYGILGWWFRAFHAGHSQRTGAFLFPGRHHCFGKYLIYALMQIPAGYLVDRYGTKRIFVSGALGTTALLCAFGFIATYWQALVIQISMGVFNGLLFMPGMIFLVDWFSPERRATALGYR